MIPDESICLKLNHQKLCQQNYQYDKNCKKIEQNKNAQGILAGWNYNLNILEVFVPYQFKELAIITLSGNLLESIQKLYQLRIPKVRKIQIGDNLFISTNSMKKCNWPNLRHIYLSNNIAKFPIDVQNFQQLNSAHLQNIIGGYTNATKNKLLKSRFRLQQLLIGTKLPKYFKKKFIMIDLNQ